MSADGRTVFFTACKSELYARVDGELPDAHTVAIAQPECGTGAAPAEAECRNAPASVSSFQGASEDGSKAFFLDTAKLTDEATEGTGSGGQVCDEAASGSDCNLYLYDFERPEGERLIDVSASEVSGESPRVQGVTASSADGSHVYFVAQGVLTSRPNAEGQSARSGQDNLYVYERDASHPEGHTAFVVALGGYYAGKEIEERKDNVTPDGRFLVFEEGGQVFRYDAETEALVRISIGNDGFNDNGNAGAGAAVIVPTSAAKNDAGPDRGDPTMSNDGSFVFFESSVGLTSHALDDVVTGYEQEEFPRNSGKFRNIYAEPVYAENVYEWHEGHVYLISDGRDVSTAPTKCSIAYHVEGLGSGTCLLGSDATGANVYFMTTDQLVPADTDTQEDIYDARICEPENGNPCVQPAAPPLPPCLGEACHGIPAGLPAPLSPGSASFDGEGNLGSAAPATAVKSKSLTKAQKLSSALKTCKKDNSKKKRAACEKQARKQFGPAKKAKKSTHRKGSK